jgi:hypothetical protein
MREMLPGCRELELMIANAAGRMQGSTRYATRKWTNVLTSPSAIGAPPASVWLARGIAAAVDPRPPAVT